MATLLLLPRDLALFLLQPSATSGTALVAPNPINPNVASPLFRRMSLKMLNTGVDAPLPCMACLRSAHKNAKGNATSPPVTDCRFDRASSTRCSRCRNSYGNGCAPVRLLFPSLVSSVLR